MKVSLVRIFFKLPEGYSMKKDEQLSSCMFVKIVILKLNKYTFVRMHNGCYAKNGMEKKANNDTQYQIYR